MLITPFNPFILRYLHLLITPTFLVKILLIKSGKAGQKEKNSVFNKVLNRVINKFINNEESDTATSERSSESRFHLLPGTVFVRPLVCCL